MDFKNWTGERLETFVETETAVEHLHRYAVTLDLVKNKTVLDIACGEGYGSNLMGNVAKEVIGVDIASEVVERAQKKYKKNNLTYQCGSASQIPLKDGYFDVVVSFETIEHHDEHEQMMTEIKRVLKPGGLLIISSPDKLNYTDKRNFHNPYHVKELYKDAFKDLIKKHFSNSNFYLQRATFSSFLVPEHHIDNLQEFSGNYQQVTRNDEFSPMYIMAIASDQSLPNINLTIFTDINLMSRLHASTVDLVHKTTSYRLGHAMLLPLKLLKNAFVKIRIR